MKKDNTYNGWTNYETWNVALWYSNTQAYEYLITRKAKDFKDIYNEDESIRRLAQWIECLVDDEKPRMSNSLYSDILNTALNEVNYKEIATYYVDQL